MKKVLLIFALMLFSMNSVFAKDFVDLSESYWAYPQIQALADDGVIAGYPDGNFKPDQPVTRAEFATMALKAINVENATAKETFEFSDVPSDYWAHDNIQRAFSFDLVKGLPDGTFNPEGSVTKAEAISLIMSSLDTDPMTLAEAKKILEASYVDHASIQEWFVINAAKADALAIVVKVPGFENKFEPDKQITRAEMAASLCNMRKWVQSRPNKKLAEVLTPREAKGVELPDVIVNGTIATIPAGSKIPVVLVQTLSSQKNTMFDAFKTVVPENLVTKEGYLVIEKDSVISGEVFDVKYGRYFVRNGLLVPETKSITPKGLEQQAVFKGVIDTSKEKKWYEKVFRAIFKGEKITLEEGIPLYVQLNKAVKIDLTNGSVID